MKIKKLFNIKDKVVVITGAFGFLGLKFTKLILENEGICILLDKKIQKNNKILKRFDKKKFLALKVDITSEIQVRNASKKIFNHYGKIDSLINNAANNPKVTKNLTRLKGTRLENFPIIDWNNDIDVSLKGSFLCAKYFGNLINKNINGGNIINISSDLGIISPDNRIYSLENLEIQNQPVKPVTYSVAKFGIIGLTKYLSTYWSSNNVRSNAICLGGVENNQDQKFKKKVSKLIPLGRMAKPNEILSTLIWMLSDSTSYLNGSVVVVDGGRTSW